MKTFQHNQKSVFIFKISDKQWQKSEHPIMQSCIIDACFYGDKPEIGDEILSLPFSINGLTVTEILENRDAKTDHWPKTISGVTYEKEDLQRKEKESVEFNPKLAFFRLKLELK